VGLIAGVLVSVRASPPLIARKGVGWTLSVACAAAAAALAFLAFVSPPAPDGWRLAGLVVIGCAAGLLHTGIFHAISPMYRHDPAATVNLGGIFFGVGCFTVALVISLVYNTATAATAEALIAVIPAVYSVVYARSKFAPPASDHVFPQGLWTEMRSPGAVLLSLLLFFQFGNEWAVAGWLPLFLSQRLGISPATSVMMLALYWLALLVGRVAAQWVLPRVRHSRLLPASVLTSVFACTVLLATDNRFGAVAGILLLGAAFAPIYPLMVERIGHRFPYFHPGFYNGIFSFALAGGLLAPCTLGYFASYWGVGVAIGLPLAGSIMVFVLLLLTGLESRLSSSVRPAAP
jgi:FHS family glucose/mannose:H+ symporter-like MFS transporter